MDNSASGKTGRMLVEMHQIHSRFLQRTVQVDIYRPDHVFVDKSLSLLLLNDGQDLLQLPFAAMLDTLFKANMISPLVSAAIHAGDRLMEYGTSGVPDYAGRGVRAGLYQQFILEELLPFIHNHYQVERFHQYAAAGFSLGGLSAFDLVWKHPQVFNLAGVFSGSFWWRSRGLDQGYDEDRDRIMHALVRQGVYASGLRFYFTTGSLDETSDRNGNGIIDSIDDTIGLIEALKQKGYLEGTDIRYINYEEGRHDIATWGRALPQFFLWGWGMSSR